jgi:hypothetical protein
MAGRAHRGELGSSIAVRCMAAIGENNERTCSNGNGNDFAHAETGSIPVSAIADPFAHGAKEHGNIIRA